LDLAGSSSSEIYQERGAGDLDVGLTATYRVVWTGSIKFTRFIGSNERQPLGDRDFISFSIERTF
jgi:hypothetical protein